MNTFETLIERQILLNPNSPRIRTVEHHTIGDFIRAVLDINDPDVARRFYEGYLEYLDKQPDHTQAAQILAKSNIGWCFGEGMHSDKIAMWARVTGSSHPVFGTVLPTAEEAFEAGKQFASKRGDSK